MNILYATSYKNHLIGEEVVNPKKIRNPTVKNKKNPLENNKKEENPLKNKI